MGKEQFASKPAYAIAIALTVISLLCCTLLSQAQGPSMRNDGVASMRPWRPNAKDANYVGPDACFKCHKEESVSQRATSMGSALEPISTAKVLSSHPILNFKSGIFSYELARKGSQTIYSVTDGVTSFVEPLAYSFGQGKAGQTYVFKHNGSFFETRVSFYRNTQNLDWTLGYPNEVPRSLEIAAGRQLSPDEVRDCFTCHATAAATAKELTLERLVPGVTCEACHGPGGDHVAAMEAKNLKEKKIFNPGKMDADELAQEFCGSCHRSAEQVIANKALQGLNSVRFQPYRLFFSKGHDPSDPRLTCIACHDPHSNPRIEESFYDDKCFACHRSVNSLSSEKVADTQREEGRTAKPCPVANKACVSCHMPKVEIPGSHFQFTDHRVRIARAGEAFPN